MHRNLNRFIHIQIISFTHLFTEIDDSIESLNTEVYLEVHVPEIWQLYS